MQTLASLSAPRNVTTPIPDAITVSQPGGPVPGTPAGATGSTVISSVGSTAGKVLAAAAVAPGVAASPPAAQAGSTSVLDLKDPWLSSALAVAVKAHMEAAPADAANIKARGFGLKTVEDLAQYYKDITPIVQNARVLARQQKVAARKLAASQTGKVQIAQLAVGTLMTEKLEVGAAGHLNVRPGTGAIASARP